MPDFTIETRYHLPVFRHRTYTADTLEEACRAALEDGNWDIAESDLQSSGPIHVAGIWEGVPPRHSGSPLEIPQQFNEPVQCRAHHFEILLGLLKILFDDIHAARSPKLRWLVRSAWAIARGEATLGGDAGQDEPIDPPTHSHVLVRLREDRVRDAIRVVLEIDPSFEGLSAEAVGDDEIHAACLAIAATMDVSDLVGNAEFQAALAAIRAAHRRWNSN